MAKLQKEVDRLEGNHMNRHSMHIRPPPPPSLAWDLIFFEISFFLYCMLRLVVCLSRLKTKLSMRHVRCLFYREKQLNYKVLFPRRKRLVN